eukprot:302463-Hanusia_phi.AAC.1
MVQGNLGRMISNLVIAFKGFAVCSLWLQLVVLDLFFLVLLLLLQTLPALAASHGGSLRAERGKSRGLEGRCNLCINEVLTRVFELHTWVARFLLHVQLLDQTFDLLAADGVWNNLKLPVRDEAGEDKLSPFCSTCSKTSSRTARSSQIFPCRCGSCDVAVCLGRHVRRESAHEREDRIRIQVLEDHGASSKLDGDSSRLNPLPRLPLTEPLAPYRDRAINKPCQDQHPHADLQRSSLLPRCLDLDARAAS